MLVEVGCLLMLQMSILVKLRTCLEVERVSLRHVVELLKQRNVCNLYVQRNMKELCQYRERCFYASAEHKRQARARDERTRSLSELVCPLSRWQGMC